MNLVKVQARSYNRRTESLLSINMRRLSLAEVRRIGWKAVEEKQCKKHKRQVAPSIHGCKTETKIEKCLEEWMW